MLSNRRRTPFAALLSGAAALSALIAGVSGAQTPAARSGGPKVTPEQAALFEAKIRPVLAESCYGCHGKDVQSAGIRLDTRDGVLKVGDKFVHAIQYDGKVKMPPSGKMKPQEIAALTAWIKAGAPWPETTAKAAPAAGIHWAFRPVKRPELPKVKNTAWAKSSIDRFILAKLEAKGLTPAAPADRRSLIRRATLDLTGLPPTPDEVAAFLADKSPDAFAKVVDRLLASPAYGERWARHWLDVARYADSNGLDENKAFAYAFRYRDWVVGALNKDTPYDIFLQEQLAGDLMPTADESLRNERLTATGFLTLGAKVLAEQDKPKMVMDIVDEQIEVTTKATMGLTVACARCHDHKFDPISTKDYYALAGIFKSTKTMKNLAFVSEWNERPLETQALAAARRDYEVKTKPLADAVQSLTRKANMELQAKLRADADKYRAAAAELTAGGGFLAPVAETPLKPGDPERVTIEAEKFARGNANRDSENYGKGIGIIHTTALPTSAEWDVTVPTAGTYQLDLRYAAEEPRPLTLSINGKVVRDDAAGNVTGGWNADSQRWEAQGVFEFVAGKNVVKIERDEAIPHIDKLLVVARNAMPSGGRPPKSVAQIAKERGLIGDVLKRFASGTKDEKALFALPKKPEQFYGADAVAEIKKAQAALDAAGEKMPEIPIAMAVEDGKIEDVKVHIRGDTQTLGDVVPRRFPIVLAGNDQKPIPNTTSGRLEFAQWLTRPENPLTARVQVNRVWQHLFGEGLVRTPDNWGVKGDKPTHPELLDFLASTFVREDRWSQKRLLRRLMLSSAYQMGSVAQSPKGATVDPENLLLWRANRRRLEAEPFRDAILAVSGKLDKTMGGTLLGTKDNDYVTNDQSGNAANYAAPRRSLYLPVIRNALFDAFQAFDFGDPSTVNAKRASTTVAPQALYVMNSPFVLEQSRAWAETLQTASTSDAQRVRLAYVRAYSRPPTPTETAKATQYIARYAAALAPSEPDPKKRQVEAWESYCQILFASNEFIYVP